jgi:hypothetical protein
MSGATQLNLDSSVLINYMNSNLPGDLEEDKGSHRLIENNSYYLVVGGKVEGEFEALCERRYDLYDDIVDFLESTDQEIFYYDPENRSVHLSDNDETHLRQDLQFNWANKNKAERLEILRRIIQEIEIYKLDMFSVHIDDCYPQQTHNNLLSRLQTDLDIGHDCEVLVDAVQIARAHSVSTLVAVDSDITDDGHAECVYEAIDDIFNESSVLDIKDAEDVS